MPYAFQIESVLEGAEDAMRLLIPSLPSEVAGRKLASVEATNYDLNLVQGTGTIAVYQAPEGISDFSRQRCKFI